MKQRSKKKESDKQVEICVHQYETDCDNGRQVGRPSSLSQYPSQPTCKGVDCKARKKNVTKSVAIINLQLKIPFQASVIERGSIFKVDLSDKMEKQFFNVFVGYIHSKLETRC